MLMSLGLTIQAHRMSSSEQDAKGAAAEAALIQLGFATQPMGAQIPVGTSAGNRYYLKQIKDNGTAAWSDAYSTNATTSTPAAATTATATSATTNGPVCTASRAKPKPRSNDEPANACFRPKFISISIKQRNRQQQPPMVIVHRKVGPIVKIVS